jgi:hypothetical protein
MTDAELDELYSQLCRTMTEVGETHSALFLARFALLAMVRIDNAACVQQLIAEAADGIGHGQTASARQQSPLPTLRREEG